MFKDDESMQRFIDSVQKAKEISLKVFKNNKRWSRIHDQFILDNWAMLSNCMYNNRSMDDTTKFLVDMFEIMDIVVGNYITIHKKKPLHWASICGSFYVQMHCNLHLHMNTHFDSNDLHLLIELIANTLNEIGENLPTPIHFDKLKIKELRLIQKIIQQWLKNTQGHKAQVAWGAAFEHSSLGQIIGGFSS